MTNELKLKLIELVEPQVVAALVAHNYVSISGKKLIWSNVIIHDDTLELINVKNNTNEDLIEQMIESFPKMGRDSYNAVSARLKQWRTKCTIENVTNAEILEATENHCKGKEDKYVGKLINFIYKHDNSIYTSRLEREIIALREKYENVSEAVQVGGADLSGYRL